MTDYLTVIEVLAIHAFISCLYETGSFEFDHLVHWLRANTAAL